MSRVHVLVEGETERTFVREILAPALGLMGIGVYSRVIGKPSHKGGVGEWQRAKREILGILKQEHDSFCSMMFDYYGMPASWPGRVAARDMPFPQKAPSVESAIHDEIAAAMGESFDARRFVPYLAMHEFEAMLFSDCEALAAAGLQPPLAELFQKIADQFGCPEAINDDPLTAPSKRIENVVPYFQKVHHGNVTAKRMGLARIREKCPHFNQWVCKLETLGS